MAKFSAVVLLACALALCTAGPAAAACVGPLVTTGCPCSTGPVGSRCKGSLACLPVDVLGLVKTEVCTLPNILPTVCNAVTGLGLGCKCTAADTLLDGTCVIPTVTSVVDSLGLPLVGDLTGLVGGLVDTALGTVSQVLPVLPTPGQVAPLLIGVACDVKKLAGVSYGCPCSKTVKCAAPAQCVRKVVVGRLTVNLAQSICLPPLPSLPL